MTAHCQYTGTGGKRLCKRVCKRVCERVCERVLCSTREGGRGCT